MEVVLSAHILSREEYSSRAVHLASGASATFGTCSCETCGHDLHIPRSEGAPIRGRITAFADHWRLDNLGSSIIRVRHLERAEAITVAGGRVSVPIPFDLASIGALGEDTAGLNVFGPEPLESQIAPGCSLAPAEDPASCIDKAALYYQVLVLLCAPQLNTLLAVPPTSSSIAETMTRLGHPIGKSAVDAHINYLIKRLALHTRTDVRRRGPWRKQLLVRHAIDVGLVTQEDVSAFRESADCAPAQSGP
ncbi:hypothetical protein QEZ54_05490 [Catellatospora sp. KI3]|uniref:hypothetical protein n=1 Tax=Catellatospora sp. KI3 TaxID=3041620 RepID=UPI0024831821|nr:hypothetical protein [Catellatospora sp. KI3]MDI1460414.1 hypothetical protein [Catellatospora sp. KI3]